MFQRMINRDSLLKLLKGLLDCGVKTHFNVHDSWLVSFGGKQYGRVTESPSVDQSSTDSQTASGEMP